MKCQQCGSEIEPGEENEHLDRILCEDCYIDALSPVRTCDPWAAHSAKTFEKYSKKADILTPVQSDIITILTEAGGADPLELIQKLDDKLELKALERELATLHHMDKIGAERKGDRVVWRVCP